MARVVIIGASIGGLPAAYEARGLLAKKHKVTVISNVESFHFVPSNPWVAVGWRTRKDISFQLGACFGKERGSSLSTPRRTGSSRRTIQSSPRKARCRTTI